MFFQGQILFSDIKFMIEILYRNTFIDLTSNCSHVCLSMLTDKMFYAYMPFAKTLVLTVFAVIYHKFVVLG